MRKFNEFFNEFFKRRDFKEPLNIVTDPQYAERVILRIETTEFTQDYTELTSLFI